jgi:hypothetical protein
MMFVSPFGFFTVLIAVVAFILARKAFNQTATLRARLDAIEAAALRAAPPTAPFEALQPGMAALRATSNGS